MKNTTLLFALLAGFFCAKGQSYEHKWNIGIHGGGTQYRGDLGDGFYRFNKAFYGFGGLSVSRYLNRRWDAQILGTRGVAGYFGTWNADPAVRTNFITDLTTVNFLAKYKFLSPESFVTPYIAGGAALLFQRGRGESAREGDKYFDYAPELGVGINFRFGKYIILQLQEMFMYTSADDIDHTLGGLNDMYVFHTVGLTVNLPKLGGKSYGTPASAAGENIDKCPKIRQHRNKATRSEGQSLRKEKKAKKLLSRKNRRAKK